MDYHYIGSEIVTIDEKTFDINLKWYWDKSFISDLYYELIGHFILKWDEPNSKRYVLDLKRRFYEKVGKSLWGEYLDDPEMTKKIFNEDLQKRTFNLIKRTEPLPPKGFRAKVPFVPDDAKIEDILSGVSDKLQLKFDYLKNSQIKRDYTKKEESLKYYLEKKLTINSKEAFLIESVIKEYIRKKNIRRA